jgi:hypothetical protein
MRRCINEGFSRKTADGGSPSNDSVLRRGSYVQSAQHAQQIFLNRIKARMIQDAMQTTLAIARVAVSWVYLAVDDIDGVDLV